MKIYMSLPLTSVEKKDKAIASEIEKILCEYGHELINPFEINRKESETSSATLGQMMGSRIQHLIDDADVVFFCKNWRYSNGCKIENYIAGKFKKDIRYEGFYNSIREFAEFLKNEEHDGNI